MNVVDGRSNQVPIAALSLYLCACVMCSRVLGEWPAKVLRARGVFSTPVFISSVVETLDSHDTFVV